MTGIEPATPNGSKRREVYTRGEEIIHSLTHGIGAGLSLIGLIILVILASQTDDPRRLIGASIFGASLVLLYLMSTLYHSFNRPRVKRFFQTMDHSAIFLLIAGTYTPFLLVFQRDRAGWAWLITIWGLAFLGVGFKLLFTRRFKRASTLAYLFLGWLSVFAGGRMLAVIPINVLIWLAVGGLSYTIGVIFYLWQRIPYNHAIWHLFVMAGSASHYIAVIYLLPR